MNTRGPSVLYGAIPLNTEEAQVFTARWHLPTPEWQEHWDRIYLQGDTKERILRYLQVVRVIGSRECSAIGTALTRTLLFHGPRGTGKTSLARGIALKYAEMVGAAPTIFFEIDSHQLSSKWLGEGGKLVRRAFQYVREAAQGCPTILLIDEVESLITDRRVSASDGNPVDVMRAVNAVLQEVDRLRDCPHVLTIATTNLTALVDTAFLDRIDLDLHLGLPGEEARASVLLDTLAEYSRSLPLARVSQEWQEDAGARRRLLAGTDGLSCRQIRKLVLRALTLRPEIAAHPEQLSLLDLIEAAAEQQPLHGHGASASRRDRRRRCGTTSGI